MKVIARHRIKEETIESFEKMDAYCVQRGRTLVLDGSGQVLDVHAEDADGRTVCLECGARLSGNMLSTESATPGKPITATLNFCPDCPSHETVNELDRLDKASKKKDLPS